MADLGEQAMWSCDHMIKHFYVSLDRKNHEKIVKNTENIPGVQLMGLMSNGHVVM